MEPNCNFGSDLTVFHLDSRTLLLREIILLLMH